MRRLLISLLCLTGCRESAEPRLPEEGSTSTPAKVSGGVDPQTVNATIHEHDKQLRACYRTALKRNPSLGAGEVRIRFIIDDRGQAIRVEDAGSRLKDKQLIACIVHEVGELRFPPPESGAPEIVYPMMFGAGDARL